MVTEYNTIGRRAVVLGGGGITGIAWEVGVLAGLRDYGTDLSNADTIIGTSAGAFVGAALAAGNDIERMFAAQFEANDLEVPIQASKATLDAWYDAFAIGGTDPVKVGAALGAISKADPEPVPLARRRAVVQARLLTEHWPTCLQVTAIDADTGQLHVFTSASGVPLVDAVSASGAVPGIWPLEHINGRSWIDGGMVSTANACLAKGHQRVVVIAPLPDGYGAIPGARHDIIALSAQSEVMLIAPDDHTVVSIGPNIYDPSRRGAAAAAGHAQGSSAAAAVVATWEQ